MMRLILAMLGALAFMTLVLAYSPAHAQTTLKQCTAHWPRKGGTFAGEMRMIHDGDTACVCAGPDPRTCVRTRLADFYAPELSQPGGRAARGALARVTAGAWLTCTHHHVTHGRSAAYCRVGGQRLGDRLRAAGVREGGNGFQRPTP